MLIVAHKGTLGHLLAAMLKLPLDGYWNFVFEQGCYSVVDLEDGYVNYTES
ncbi:MAG: histidine phosphatase family protein [Anaerobutyricum sp.]